MRKIFCIVFVLIGVNVFCNSNTKYNETLGWMNKNENDVVRGGGKFVIELDLNFGKGPQKMRMFRIDTPEGNFRLSLIDNIVNSVEYWNDIVYSSRNEFNREVERIQNLVQSLNGNLTNNYNTKTNNYKTYKAISNKFQIRIEIEIFNTNNGLSVFDEPLRFGSYRIIINKG
jgi:hypothetical protein